MILLPDFEGEVDYQVDFISQQKTLVRIIKECLKITLNIFSMSILR